MITLQVSFNMKTFQAVRSKKEQRDMNTYIFMFSMQLRSLFLGIGSFCPFFLNFCVFIFYNQNHNRTLSSIPKLSKKFWPKILSCAFNTFNSHSLQKQNFFISSEPVHWQRPASIQTNLFHNFLILKISRSFSHTFMLLVLLSRIFTYFHCVKVITQLLFLFNPLPLAAKCEKYRTVSSWPTYKKFEKL